MNSAALKQQGNDNLAAKKLKCAIADYTKARASTEKLVESGRLTVAPASPSGALVETSRPPHLLKSVTRLRY